MNENLIENQKFKNVLYFFVCIFAIFSIVAFILILTNDMHTSNIRIETITLNHENLVLEKEESTTIVATITPLDVTNKAVTWTSSNPNVATVDSGGNVTAVHEGSTIVTAAIDGKSASVTINVIAKTIKVETISLNIKNQKLYLNSSSKQIKLVATISPSDSTNKIITWTSSNSNVATVDSNGNVTAVHKGSTIVTATIDGKSASATIDVSDKTTPVTALKLSKEKVILKYGKSVKLTASVIPSDATNKVVTWKSSNEKLVTVDDTGKVVAKSGRIGSATITATTKDGGFSKEVKVIVFPSGNYISFQGGSNYIGYKTNMLLQREGAVMQSFAFNDDYVYITQQQAGAGASFSKIKLDSVTNLLGEGQKFKNNVAIIRDTGHAANIDIEVADDGTYLWTSCSTDSADVAYHCRIPLKSVQFGNAIVQEQNYNIKVSGSNSISVDEKNRTIVVMTGSKRYHKFSVYNLDDYINSARNGTKAIALSSFSIDKKDSKYHRQGFSVYGNYIYDYEGNYTNEKDSAGNPVPYDIFLSVYTLDGKEVVGRTKINYPDENYYWEPEGIQIYNNKIYIGMGRIEKKSNPRKTANIYVLK